MPDFMISPFDNLPVKADPVPPQDPGSVSGSTASTVAGPEVRLRGPQVHGRWCKKARLCLSFLRIFSFNRHCRSHGSD